MTDGRAATSAAALSFGAIAPDYDAARPGYAQAALAAVLDAVPRGGRILEIGCGPGHLTKLLRRLRPDVEIVALDPDPRMLTAFRGDPELAGVAVHERGGEDLGDFPAGTFDCVVVGEAYHWLERERADAEIARVLRPGGWFVALWHLRDYRQALIKQIEDLAALFNPSIRDQFPDGVKMNGAPWRGEMRTPFGHFEFLQYPFSKAFRPAAVMALYRSYYRYLLAPEALRRRFDAQIEELLAGAALDDGGCVSLRFCTLLWRAQRLELTPEIERLDRAGFSVGQADRGNDALLVDAPEPANGRFVLVFPRIVSRLDGTLLLGDLRRVAQLARQHPDRRLLVCTDAPAVDAPQLAYVHSIASFIDAASPGSAPRIALRWDRLRHHVAQRSLGASLRRNRDLPDTTPLTGVPSLFPLSRLARARRASAAPPKRADEATRLAPVRRR